MEDWKQELEEILEDKTDTGKNMIPKYARCYARIILENFIEQEIERAKREAQIEVLTEIFQTCYQEDSKTLELVEEKLSKLTTK